MGQAPTSTGALPRRELVVSVVFPSKKIDHLKSAVSRHVVRFVPTCMPMSVAAFTRRMDALLHKLAHDCSNFPTVTYCAFGQFRMMAPCELLAVSRAQLLSRRARMLHIDAARSTAAVRSNR